MQRYKLDGTDFGTVFGTDFACAHAVQSTKEAHLRVNVHYFERVGGKSLRYKDKNMDGISFRRR